MKARALHRITGVVMLLPLLGWAITGLIFFLKPGYADAYDALLIKTYPLETSRTFDASGSWLEVRYLKTILGEHLLARTSEGWSQLDPESLRARPQPTEEEIRALVVDAISPNPSRYGHIVSVQENTARTDTGVRVTLDWSRLTLTQRGKDTDWIDFFYKIHYLQWTGAAVADKVLGAAGILLLLALGAFGARLFFSKG